MATASNVVIVILVVGTLVVHLGNYYLRQQKDWRAKVLLILGWVLAAGIAAQYYFNYQLAAPRTLNEKERNRIAEKMKQFAGQEYTGLVGSGVADASDLWREIGLSLDLAGWQYWCCIPQPSRTIARLPYGGHEVSITPAAPEGILILWQGAAQIAPTEALAKALRAEGILAGSGPTMPIGYPNTVVIEIGPKPQK
jgi:hypothetical protein